MISALLIVASMSMPIHVIATPTPPDPYPYVYANWVQGHERAVAVDAITRRLKQLAAVWEIVDRAQREAVVVEVTQVTAKASGEPFFIRHGLPTNRHWEVSTLVHFPGGQTKRFTGADIVISAAAIDAADQAVTWLTQRQ